MSDIDMSQVRDENVPFVRDYIQDALRWLDQTPGAQRDRAAARLAEAAADQRQVVPLARVGIPSRPLSYQARARRTDPPTSHEAAHSVRNITATHQRILTLLSDWGQMTDEQMLLRYNEWRERRYGWPPISESGLRTRRRELVDAGRVVDSGEKGRTAAGRSTTIWRLAD